MLFSLFFGAGNLIFPPFLGQNAGEHTFTAMAGFLLTAVVLQVLGVIVVARFDGLDKLSGKTGKRFEFIFTVLIYLSIGPGLGIPRAASVPFEMAVSPYWIVKCSQFPSCVDFTGFNCIQNCVYCYYLSFFSKIALKHRPHYFHIYDTKLSSTCASLNHPTIKLFISSNNTFESF